MRRRPAAAIAMAVAILIPTATVVAILVRAPKPSPQAASSSSVSLAQRRASPTPAPTHHLRPPLAITHTPTPTTTSTPGRQVITAPDPAPSTLLPSVCVGLRLAPGSDVQAAIDAEPPGATFCFSAGTYAVSSLAPKSGDVLDGGNRASVLDGRSSAQYAVRSSSAIGVTVRGFVIRDYMTPIQQGAVQAFGTTGWVIQNNDINHNAAAGVAVDTGARVIGNRLDYNGQEG
jgi:hypothetical protein